MSWKKTLLYYIFQTIRSAGKQLPAAQIRAYYPRWKASFRPGRTSVADEWPWINFPALDFLEKNLQPGFRVFEFGGGGSTLFFCKRVAEVVTVEDHAEWFKTLTDMIGAKGYQNWTGFFVAPEPVDVPGERSKENPADFKSGAKGLENLSYERYARAIDPYPEAWFDLVLVDGRARPSCIQQALPHIKPGGYLVIDNTERPYYLTAFKDVLAEDFRVEIDCFAPVPYTPDFTRTSVLRKV